jgi:predicted amidohydrolase
MRNLRVALAQIAPRLGDLDANLTLHLETARRARSDGADVVVFPELSLTGYLLRDQTPDVALRLDEPTPPITALLDASREIDLVFGFVEEAAGHRFHNACAYLSGGQVVHVQRKLYLTNYGMFEEARDFAAGEQLRRFDSPHGPAGLLICEDLWHQTCAWLLAQEGAEVLFGVSNGPSRGARPGRGVTSVNVWTDLLRVTAQFLTTYIVYVNRVGGEDGLTFGGGSFVADPFGRVVASLPALDEAMTVVELRQEVLRRARTAYPLLRDENLELVHRELGRIRRARYDLPAENNVEDEASPADAPAIRSISQE